MIRHILLLPHESTRAVLLAPGAPVAADLGGWTFGWTVPENRVIQDDGDVGDADSVRRPRHLVLARDGAEVYEGTNRLRRVLAEHVGAPTDTGGVVFHGAHGDGLRERRWTTWALHDWSSADSVQFYGDPAQAWSAEGPHRTIYVPALAAPPWPAVPRHPLLTVWALALCAQSQGLGTVILLDAEGREVSA